MVQFLIVTTRSLLWMIISLIATFLMLSALLSPAWLSASPEEATYHNETISYTPSVGVVAKCAKPISINHPACTLLAVRGFATDSKIFPTVWKIATFFLALGLTVMSFTVFTSFLSCCYQSFFRKSIFTMSGAAQALAGICFIIGVMLHPMAWGSHRVQKLCGRDASPFYFGNCSIGLGLWLAVVSTILTFVSACLSVPAESSTSSDRVQEKIYEGNTLICLP